MTALNNNMEKFSIGPYVIDDSSIAANNVLWSSKNIYEKTALNGSARNVAFFDGYGSVYDRNIKISDNLPPSENVIYSSLKNSQFVDDTKISPSTTWSSQKISTIGSGNTMIIDDTVQGPSTTWSSNKIASLTPQPVESVNGSIATFKDGLIQPSNIVISEDVASPNVVWTSSATQSKLDGKLNIVSPFTESRIPIFSSDGQLKDSSVALQNLLTKEEAQLTFGDQMKLSIPIKPSSIAILDPTGQVRDSGFLIDDNMMASPTVQWSSFKIDDTYMKKLKGNGTIPILNVDGQLVDSVVKINDFQKKIIPTKINPLTTLDASGQIQENILSVNDESLGNNIIWTSAKNDSTFLKQIKGQNTIPLLNEDGQLRDSLQSLDNIALKNIPLKDGNFASLDLNGQYVDSGKYMDDNETSLQSLWSSTKNDSTFLKQIKGKNTIPLLNEDGQLRDSTILITNLMEKKIPINLKNVCQLDSSGQVIDSGFKIDDNDTNINVIWSSDKINSTFIKKLPGTVNAIPKYDVDGNLINSQYVFDDSSTSPNNIWSSDKIDKTYLKYTNLKPNFLLSTNANLSAETVYNINDVDNVGSTNSLYSSEKINKLLEKKANLSIPAAANNLASIDATGQYKDSAFKVDDTSLPASNVLYSSLKFNEKANLSIPAAANNLASIDATGQYKDSAFKVDDTSLPASNVLYTSAKLLGNTKVFLANTFTSSAVNTWVKIPLEIVSQGRGKIKVFINIRLTNNAAGSMNVNLRFYNTSNIIMEETIGGIGPTTNGITAIMPSNFWFEIDVNDTLTYGLSFLKYPYGGTPQTNSVTYVSGSSYFEWSPI